MNAKNSSESIENKVFKKIKKAKRGSLFFVDDFVSFGSAKTLNKVLERLEQKGELMRVAQGIYVWPETDAVVGVVRPTTEKIAQAIAKRDKARIIPTGASALNSLGLSTQVPMNVVYLTDGAARKIKVGKRSIIFKKTTPKNLATKGEISGLAIQALKEIGKDKLSETEKNAIISLLKKENTSDLKHDIVLAPEWIRSIMKQVLTEEK